MMAAQLTSGEKLIDAFMTFLPPKDRNIGFSIASDTQIKGKIDQNELSDEIRRQLPEIFAPVGFGGVESWARLFNGDLKNHDNDHSSADCALIGLCVRKGLSAADSDRVMRASLLYRPKWDEFRGDLTYGQRTLTHIFNSQQDQHSHAVTKVCAHSIHPEAPDMCSAAPDESNSWLDLNDGIIEISDVPPRPRDFVIQDLLVAAKSAVLAGQGGVAKSQLLLQFGVAVALGLPIFGFGTKEGSVILLMGEEDADEVYRRINAIAKVMRLTSEQKALLKQRLRVFPLVGADIRLTRSINMAIESTGLSDEIVKAAKLLEQESGLSVRLIGLDHAGLVHGGEFNTREDVVQTMRQVNHLAKSTGAAVLILAHSPKSTAKSEWSTSQDVAGSAAWVDLSRAAFVLRAMSEAEGKQLSISAEDRKGYVSLTTVKGNYISTGDHIWLAKNRVDGYEVSYLTHTKLTTTGQSKVGGNRKLRASILELSGQRDLTKTSIERYSGKSGELRASKGAIKAEVDAMLEDGDLVLVQPTEEQRRKLGIKGPTSGFLKAAKEAN